MPSSYYTVSMKLFCVLLNITMPMNSNTTINTKLYASQFHPINSPAPNTPYLKVSKTGVTGLRRIRVYRSNPAAIFPFTKLRGYTMGVAYIHSDKTNENRICKSLYFVVILEITRPNPKASPAIIITSIGNNKAYQFIWALQPPIAYII